MFASGTVTPLSAGISNGPASHAGIHARKLLANLFIALTIVPFFAGEESKCLPVVTYPIPIFARCSLRYIPCNRRVRIIANVPCLVHIVDPNKFDME